MPGLRQEWGRATTDKNKNRDKETKKLIRIPVEYLIEIVFDYLVKRDVNEMNEEKWRS